MKKLFKAKVRQTIKNTLYNVGIISLKLQDQAGVSHAFIGVKKAKVSAGAKNEFSAANLMWIANGTHNETMNNRPLNGAEISLNETTEQCVQVNRSAGGSNPRWTDVDCEQVGFAVCELVLGENRIKSKFLLRDLMRAVIDE